MTERSAYVFRLSPEKLGHLREFASSHGFRSINELLNGMTDLILTEASRQHHTQGVELEGDPTPIESMFDNLTVYKTRQSFRSYETKEAKDRGGDRGRRSRYGQK